ncbi:helix-turn-helix domain-containing protein [Tsukamurella spumae]|uniref:Helix-turn-helix domain-containing protein n=2 Tax=Tsukamurella spumae TaxID=44753 RepID=A0A846WYU0_9ACTN|nr:helix-turn-helix domain-containing protein [Tsukamurella spumae]
MESAGRDGVLTLIRTQGPLTATEVAAALDVHVSTARFHLTNLVESGLAETAPDKRRTVGRPRVTYAARPQAPTAELLGLLLAQLGPTPELRERAAADAGRLWAASRAVAAPSDGLPDPAAVASTILRGLGFEIESTTSAFGTHTLQICACPLQSLASDSPEIARGVVRGAIEQALAISSPSLGSQYAVRVHPDPHGDCAISVRLAPMATRSV